MTVLRSLLFSIWFFAVSFVLSVIGQVLAETRPQNLIAFARLWSRVVMTGLPICGIRLEVTGEENIPKDGPALIASMHQSAFDTLLWFNLVDRCRYVVKIELTRIPIFGRLVRLSGQVAVDRAGGGATLRGLLREGGATLAAGNQLVIFPEGTRAAPGKVSALQPGIAALARHSGLPVIPVVTDSGHCWGRGALAKRPGTIHVAILPPIETGLPRDVLMARLQAAFEEGFAALGTTGRPVDKSVG